jgi:hypothetical protein
VKLADIANLEPQTTVDIIGVCSLVEDATTVTKRSDNTTVLKRSVWLIDESVGKSEKDLGICLTLWDAATKMVSERGRVIVIRQARVGAVFNERKGLSLGSSSSLLIEPKLPEVEKLKLWYEDVGINLPPPLSPVASETKTYPLRMLNGVEADEGIKFKNFATITSIGGDIMYKACIVCNKKLSVQDLRGSSSGSSSCTYRCVKCGREFKEYKWKMMARVSFYFFPVYTKGRKCSFLIFLFLTFIIFSYCRIVIL